MKAQAISMDLMTAVIIVLLIVVAITAILSEYSSFQEQEAKNRDMEIRGQEAMNSLLSTGDETWSIKSVPSSSEKN